jgi:hypothetical protein
MSAIDTTKLYPPKTTGRGLVECLTDVFKDCEASDVRVVFIGYERDEQGNPVLIDDEYRLLIRHLDIYALGDGVSEEVKNQYDKAPLLSMMILFTKQGKVGVLQFKSVEDLSKHEYKEWEQAAITDYFNRKKQGL